MRDQTADEFAGYADWVVNSANCRFSAPAILTSDSIFTDGNVSRLPVGTSWLRAIECCVKSDIPGTVELVSQPPCFRYAIAKRKMTVQTTNQIAATIGTM